LKPTLEQLEGAFRGRTLLVVSCGPSATEWKKVRAKLPDDLVIGCVKQAIFLCANDAQIHFFNPFNCNRYFPHNRKALKVFVDDECAPKTFNPRDLSFYLDPKTCSGLEATVAATGRFEDYTIENSGTRKPWGPGILYEIVFYLAIHLGFSEVHTIGWDVVREQQNFEAPERQLEHFYDDKQPTVTSAVTSYEWCTKWSAVYGFKALGRHILGRGYNRMPKSDPMGEIPLILRSLPTFFHWIESHGISVTVHSFLNHEIADPAIRAHVMNLADDLLNQDQ
jgi:hypothetical protein